MTTTTDTISVAERDRGPFVAPDTELEVLQRAARALNQSESGSFKLITNNGQEIEVPLTLLRVLRLGAEMLALDRAVVLDSLGRQITPHEAAELLRVPITYLVKLLDDGTLPFTRDGDFRRLSLDDVLTYRQLRDQQRHAALDEMTRMGQEWGLYDIDYSTIKAKRLAEFDDESKQ
ncbi:MAG: excisionase family DNA-binding protein [Chloroflexota bacterium]|nr:excisionase family DNA-binding protein [Chloroflexota bacterium]